MEPSEETLAIIAANLAAAHCAVVGPRKDAGANGHEIQITVGRLFRGYLQRLRKGEFIEHDPPPPPEG